MISKLQTPKQTMCYVAADPNQPRAAWAFRVDDPDYRDDPADKKQTAKSLADWVKRGGIIMYVPIEQAREMMLKWVRPSKDNANPNQLTLL